jgi:PAS domain S-box-containing protein
MIRDYLSRAGREDLADTAELLVSEIVTNALVHAGTNIEVAFSFVDGGLRIEVTDGSPHAPSPRSYGPSAGTGRGLLLLEEMVDAWGVEFAEHGKTVWFTIASERHADGSPAAALGEPARTMGETVTVTLVDVPLLLHEAWRQHAEALLREHLLVSLDLDGDDPIAVHAEASDAIAVLAEHIPPSGVGEDPAQVMVSATEPRVSRPRVDLAVPLSSVPHFATLDRTIRRALAMVEDGLFLTPPVQPELQELRRWLCSEVRRQSGGEAPAPWCPQDEPPQQLVHPLYWDPTPVVHASTAVIAADDADRIVAVSDPALRLLGYDHPAELVGMRLVTIIPPRYHQAHLAGFTMHLLTGRAPLVGRTVVVPALRRDGTEAAVELTISVEHTRDGRAVFLATLEGAEPAG